MWLKIYLLSILVISVFTFVALFGALPQFEGSTVWKFRKWIVSRPAVIRSWDSKYTGGRISRVSGVCGSAIAPVAPWLVPILYCAFTTYMFSAYYEDLHPFIAENHWYYAWLAPVAYTILVVSFVLATFSDPGVITKQNHAQILGQFAYDEVLFLEDMECSTCKFAKPARSKHDRFTNKCVAKFDHYCLWINNTVGLYNYRWFLFFLLGNVWTLCWGALLAALKMVVMVDAEFKNNPHPPNVFKRWWYVILINENKRVGIIFLISLSTGALACAFTAMHFYYIYLGATTNETDKWGDIHAAVAEGSVWMFQRPGFTPERSIMLQKDEQGRPNRLLTQAEKDYIEQHDLALTQLTDHKPIVNIYDKGFLNNLKAVMFPKSAY
ncbi:Palmitoyltransferase SWF1 [Yarrowia sp. B02]|nr:Palmitoyltransferase SWF1 [Yarrowia sp. B02]